MSKSCLHGFGPPLTLRRVCASCLRKQLQRPPPGPDRNCSRKPLGLTARQNRLTGPLFRHLLPRDLSWHHCRPNASECSSPPIKKHTIFFATHKLSLGIGYRMAISQQFLNWRSDRLYLNSNDKRSESWPDRGARSPDGLDRAISPATSGVPSGNATLLSAPSKTLAVDAPRGTAWSSTTFGPSHMVGLALWITSSCGAVHTTFLSTTC